MPITQDHNLRVELVLVRIMHSIGWRNSTVSTLACSIFGATMYPLLKTLIIHSHISSLLNFQHALVFLVEKWICREAILHIPKYIMRLIWILSSLLHIHRQGVCVHQPRGIYQGTLLWSSTRFFTAFGVTCYWWIFFFLLQFFLSFISSWFKLHIQGCNLYML